MLVREPCLEVQVATLPVMSFVCEGSLHTRHSVCCLHAERATTSEVKRWVKEAAQVGRGDTSDRVAHVATALRRLTEEVEQDRGQAASVAGDYTPHQLQVHPTAAGPQTTPKPLPPHVHASPFCFCLSGLQCCS